MLWGLLLLFLFLVPRLEVSCWHQQMEEGDRGPELGRWPLRVQIVITQQHSLSHHTIIDNKMQITNPRYCHGCIAWCWACHSLSESDGILQSELRHQTSVSNPPHPPLSSPDLVNRVQSSTQSRFIKYPRLLITSRVNQIQTYTDRI